MHIKRQEIEGILKRESGNYYPITSLTYKNVWTCRFRSSLLSTSITALFICRKRQVVEFASIFEYGERLLKIEFHIHC
jgi:hypothetical protein